MMVHRGQMWKFELHERRRHDDYSVCCGCLSTYVVRLGQPPRPMLADYKAIIQQHRVLVFTEGGMAPGGAV
jgi:hypothetical protein